VSAITTREAEQVEKASASGLTPVVFNHGLWLLAGSWDRWAARCSRRPATPRWLPAGRTIPRPSPRFANAVSEQEARELYPAFMVPGSGAPLFQAATANLNPRTEAKVDSANPDRGPLLIINGEKDHPVPWAIAHASYRKQVRNAGTTEIVEIPGRGHALTIDSGWRKVADTALEFVRRFV
jgi:pimeloyl-ACP methyl ester carboxylesterase